MPMLRGHTLRLSAATAARLLLGNSLLVLLLWCGSPNEAFATNQQGHACTSGNAALSVNGAVDDANNLTCISSVWQYPVYVLQSAAASAGSSCSSYPAGAMRWNTTLTDVEVCDGTNWRFLAASTTSCGSPSGLSFTNLTSQSLSTSVNTLANPATITFSGCSGGGLAVSVSGAATAQISINGGPWVTSAVITSGQTLNVRMTTSGSVSTVLTATITVGSTSTNWTTTTQSWSLKIFQTAGAYVTYQMGSLAGADAICQSEANTAGFTGTYQAVLSSDSVSAASRLTYSYPIVNAYNGSTVAVSNLWSGVLSNAILNPSGGYTMSSAYGYAYPDTPTGTNADGTISTGNTCSSWTNSGGNLMVGVANNTTTAWTAAGVGGWCGGSSAIYCIQQ
jgi:hypothetical protein